MTEIPKISIKRVQFLFDEASKTTGIKIYPHLLRSVFAREMSKAGVQDRFIDAFCGRIPQSVLARSYTDYSPEVLKEIYSKANIKILE
jgi:integrase